MFIYCLYRTHEWMKRRISRVIFICLLSLNMLFIYAIEREFRHFHLIFTCSNENAFLNIFHYWNTYITFISAHIYYIYDMKEPYQYTYFQLPSHLHELFIVGICWARDDDWSWLRKRRVLLFYLLKFSYALIYLFIMQNEHILNRHYYITIL